MTQMKYGLRCDSVALPCVISYFQTAHCREEKNREEEKLTGGD